MYACLYGFRSGNYFPGGKVTLPVSPQPLWASISVLENGNSKTFRQKPENYHKKTIIRFATNIRAIMAYACIGRAVESLDGSIVLRLMHSHHYVCLSECACTVYIVHVVRVIVSNNATRSRNGRKKTSRYRITGVPECVTRREEIERCAPNERRCY